MNQCGRFSCDQSIGGHRDLQDSSVFVRQAMELLTAGGGRLLLNGKGGIAKALDGSAFQEAKGTTDSLRL